MNDKAMMTKHLSGRHFTPSEMSDYLNEYSPCDYMGNVVYVPKWIYRRMDELTGGIHNTVSRDLFETHIRCAVPLIF